MDLANTHTPHRGGGGPDQFSAAGAEHPKLWRIADRYDQPSFFSFKPDRIGNERRHFRCHIVYVVR